MINEDAKEKVDDLIDVNYKITNAWELEFIDSVQGMDEFSEKQLEKIDELWRKHCGN